MMRYLPFIIISLVLYTLFFYHNQEPELLSVNDDLSEQIIKQKVIPLDFKEVAKLDKDILLAPLTDEPNGALEETTEPTAKPGAAEISTTPVTVDLQPEVVTETITVSSDLQPKVVTETITAESDLQPQVASKSNHNTTEIVKNSNSPQINIEKMKLFQASIKSTEASDVALIKGEFYERDFHLDLPAPPASPKPALVTPTLKESEVDSDALSSKLIEKDRKLTQKTELNTAITAQNEKPKRVFKKPVKSQLAAPLAGVQVAIAVSGKKPSYPPEAKAEKLQGTVSAKFIVSMQGKSRNAKIITSSGHQILDNALLKFIANERFMPALKGIEKITSEQQFTFKFQY